MATATRDTRAFLTVVAGAAAVGTLLHFALGLAAAAGVNRWHRAVWPLPRSQEELDRQRPVYAGHLAAFVPVMGVAYVACIFGLQQLYGRVLLPRWYARDDRLPLVVNLFVAIGVVLGFAWGSSVTATKCGYLCDDYRWNPGAK